MRHGTPRRSWAARLLGVLVVTALAGLVAAPAAQAAAPARSLTPFVSCYFDNGNGTVTVSVGVTSTNGATVSVPVGADNRVTVGAQDRGQPTSFSPGTHNNVWAATVSYTDIANNVNWSLTGNTVQFASFQECASKPVPAQGNTLAVVLFAAMVTAGGSLLLGERRRRMGTSGGNGA